jgi:hypothetical protein
MAKLPHFSLENDNVRIRGFSQRVRNVANDVDIRSVVSALSFGHLDPAGREITDIGNLQRKWPSISVRLDRQANTTDGSANLQVQVNDSALRRIQLNRIEGTTIAQVIVPAAVYRTAFSCHESNIRLHLENIVRSALLQSSNSFGFQYRIVEA